MPAILILEDQFEKIKQKCIAAQKMLKTNTRTQKIQSKFKKAKRKFGIAQQVISNPPKPGTRSPLNREGSVVKLP